MSSLEVVVRRRFYDKTKSCLWVIKADCSRSWGSWECEVGSRRMWASMTVGTRQTRTINLSDSIDGSAALAVASELEARGIPFRLSRGSESTDDGVFEEGWGLGLLDAAREEETRHVLEEAIPVDLDDVASHWAESVLGFGLEAEDVCHPPASASEDTAGDLSHLASVP